KKWEKFGEKVRKKWFSALAPSGKSGFHRKNLAFSPPAFAHGRRMGFTRFSLFFPRLFPCFFPNFSLTFLPTFPSLFPLFLAFFSLFSSCLNWCVWGHRWHGWMDSCESAAVYVTLGACVIVMGLLYS